MGIEASIGEMKTHRTAVVLIPPGEVWEPIQRIRRVHDRQIRRWMPHVTLLYPFRPRKEFAEAFGKVEAACARAEPFACTLASFRYFEHASSHTMWLAPEPAEQPVALQAELVREFPDCDDTSRFERRRSGSFEGPACPDGRAGFTPHLSVGQVRERAKLDGLLRDLAAEWEPVEFEAREVAMIWRGRETGDVFRVWRKVGLGSAGPAEARTDV